MDRTTETRCPVRDFNHESPEHAQDWPAEFRKMREECPRAWTEKHGGYWVATRYNDILKIAQSSDMFTSGKSVNAETGEIKGGVLLPPTPVPATIPTETDNPEWHGYRQFLGKRFGPRFAEERRAFAEDVATTLIDRVIETGSFDVVADFTSPLPAIVTLDLFGFDLHNWHEIAEPIHKYIYTQHVDPEFPKIVAGIERIRQMFQDGAADRRTNPRDDLLSYIANGTIDGRPLSDHEVIAMALNILFGGVDTTTALTSNVLRYLSQHPESRRRLIDEPALVPRAREEFLRYFTPVHGLARSAAADVDVDGWRIKKGDRVLLALASANRDVEIFEDAEEIHLDRFPNRHIGFGAGIHRCIGSFLARTMFETMLSEVLRRMPDYQVIEEKSKAYPSVALINGWISVPAVFTPSPKLGGRVQL